MRCIDLVSDIVKILGIYYSYNEKLDIQEKLKSHLIKIKKSLQIWRMRDISILGKMTVFKTLAISKIIHLALVKTIPNSIIQKLNKIQKEFLWKTRNPKVKHDTLCTKYENGGLKKCWDKGVILQCSWIKRLYDSNSHNWKVIPLHMITQKLGKKFLFNSNLVTNPKQINRFPQHYQEIFRKWSSNQSVSPNIPSTIISQDIWFNKHIKNDNKSLCNRSLTNEGINHVGQTFSWKRY